MVVNIFTYVDGELLFSFAVTHTDGGGGGKGYSTSSGNGICITWRPYGALRDGNGHGYGPKPYSAP